MTVVVERSRGCWRVFEIGAGWLEDSTSGHDVFVCDLRPNGAQVGE